MQNTILDNILKTVKPKDLKKMEDMERKNIKDGIDYIINTSYEEVDVAAMYRIAIVAERNFEYVMQNITSFSDTKILEVYITNKIAQEILT